MSNFKTLLQDEMRRAARKELKELKDTVAEQKKVIKELTRRLEALEKKQASVDTSTPDESPIPIHAKTSKSRRKSRKYFSISMMQDFRKKYFITNETLAKLLGVAFATVERWFMGMNKPSEKNIEAFLALTELSDKQLFALIAEKAPKSLSRIEKVVPKKYDPQKFLKSLLEFRNRNSLSQETIAKLLGCEKGNISKWETGRSAPSFQFVQKFYALEKLSQEKLYALMAEKAPKAFATLKKINERENSGPAYLKTIISLRKKYSISQNTLSKLLGVTRRSVYVWECGTIKPNDENLKAIEALAKLDEKDMLALIAEKTLKKPATENVPAEPVASEPVTQPKTPEPVQKNPGSIVLTVASLK